MDDAKEFEPITPNEWQAIKRIEDQAAEIKRLKAELKSERIKFLQQNGQLIDTCEAQLATMRDALEFLVADQCDYMIRNHLGDPEEQHGVKMARQALATDAGKAAADVLAAAVAWDMESPDPKTSHNSLVLAVSAYRNEGRNDG